MIIRTTGAIYMYNIFVVNIEIGMSGSAMAIHKEVLVVDSTTTCVIWRLVEDSFAVLLRTVHKK